MKMIYLFFIISIIVHTACGNNPEEKSKPKVTRFYTQSYSLCNLDSGPQSYLFKPPRNPAVVKLKLDYDQFEEIKEVILKLVPVQNSSYLNLIETLPAYLSSELDSVLDEDYYKYNRIEGINYFKNFAAYMLYYLSRDLNITKDQIFRGYANLNKDIDSKIYLEVSFNDRDEDKVEVFKRPFCELRLDKSTDKVYKVSSKIKYVKTRKKL